jgi:hypothetical protein
MVSNGQHKMTKSKIFLIGDDENQVTTLEETGYLTEAKLQALVSNYPDLLPGDQINPENPRQWLLVSREMRVPDDASETGRWSLDHLFLDQDGIPTFVECKRATDTRIRREVVAQMLDYAANGIEYWSIDRLISAATDTAERQGKEIEEEIVNLLEDTQGYGVDVDAYWQQVEANLRARKVRLVFVADKTPQELRRLVEFLNEEMRNVEVLAVEVKQFQREDRQGQKAVVPRVVGFTEAARQIKTSTTSRSGALTPEEFFAMCDPAVADFYHRTLRRAEQRGYIIEWGKASASIRAKFPNISRLATFAYCYATEFHFYFWAYFRRNSLELRKRLLAFGVFRESGKWTLKADMTPDTLTQMDDVVVFILDQMDILTRARG